MATLLASLVLAVAAPLASASVTVVSAGLVPQGGSSAPNTASFTFTENSAACFSTGPSPAALVVQIWDLAGASTVHFGTPNPPTAPTSLGATVVVSSTATTNDTFTVKFLSSDSGNPEQIIIAGLVISADSNAMPGAISAKLTGTEARCVLPPTTATGTLQNSQSVGSASILVHLTSPCPFSQNLGIGADPNAGKLSFATNPESVNVSAATGVLGQQQTLTIDPTTLVHPAGESVTQTVSNCSPAIGSPGVVVRLTGRLCITKYNDLNGNGVQDGNPLEPLLSGWVFTVKDNSGTVAGTITTSAAGAKDCIDLPAGTYTVTENGQQGWVQMPPVPGGPQTVTITAGQTTNVSFGNQQTGRLCITKFNDLNGNGLHEANEPFLANWQFNISQPGHQWFLPGHGLVIAVGPETGPDGQVCQELLPGTYLIEEVPHTGWVQTVPVGSPTVTITAGQTTNVSFGNHQGQLLCVAKFNDLNGNGVRDGNPLEPLLSGWVFTVKDNNGTVVATLYSVKQPCTDLPAGTYTVTETLQNGWTPTTAGGVTQTVTVVAGQPLNLIFGNHRCCLTFVFLGGKIDNFSLANGATAEPVTPASITATPAYFDATKGDRAFAHRFYLGAGNCIQSATLEIRIKALPGGSTNDTLGIKVPGSSSWAKPISAIPPSGTWTPPKVKTVVFNLGAMPAGGGSTSLISALDQGRMLDINIQDDTSVDYIKLTVVFCECVR